MLITKALIQLRDDLRTWVLNNLGTKLNKNLGSTEKGKILSVNETGDIVTIKSTSITDSIEAVNYLSTLVGDIPVSEQIDLSLASVRVPLSLHVSNTENPHAVTKTQIGLSNVNNTSDANKPISIATQIELDTKQNILAFDAVPIENSKNLVTSNGIKMALDMLNSIDYENYIAFDTSWIVPSGISNATAILGHANLGTMVLGTY